MLSIDDIKKSPGPVAASLSANGRSVGRKLSCYERYLGPE